MILLLDTQVALWWLAGSSRLRAPARELLAGSACVLSVASVWEVAIKHRIGKLSVGPALFRDRMLIAQARVEKLRAVSADRAWRGYELDLATV